MKIIIYSVFLVLLTPLLQAQDDSRAADKAYKNKAYAKYVEYFKNKNLTKLKTQTLEQLGESYRKIGDENNTQKAYAVLAARENIDPLNYYYYAQALQRNGDYRTARAFYKKCDDKLKESANGEPYDDRAAKGWRATFLIEDIKAIGTVQIKGTEGINSEKYDFSPMYYKEGVVFVSNNEKSNIKDRWLGDGYMDLFYAKESESGVLSDIEPFSEAINSKYHEGPVTFTKDQDMVFFTRSNFNKGQRGKSKDGTTKLKIYSADKDKEGGDWINIEELPFNTSEFDYCHPALSPDERILVFASNKKGGYGRMDLYGCYWNGGEWSKPFNLGPHINTAGDEVFPFIHADGTLYYSSDGGLGLGGLDIFMAVKSTNHPDTTWSYAYNIGAPLNSQNDDFGFILHANEKSGYLSSDREGSKGEDDILRFDIPDGFDDVKPLPLLPIDFCIYDKHSSQRIEGAHLTIRRVSAYAHNISVQQKNELGEIEGKTMVLTLTPSDELNTLGKDKYAVQALDSTQTNKEGLIKYKLRAGDNYIIEIRKEGYRTTLEYFTMLRERDHLDEYCIGLNSSGLPEWIVSRDEEGMPQVQINQDLPPIPIAQINPNVEFSKENPFLVGVVLNKEYQKPLPNAKVFILNRCTGEEEIQTVGAEGRFGFPLECGCEYIVKSRKQRFIGDSKVISLVDGNCTSVQMELLMTPGFDRVGNPLSIGGNELTETIKEGDVLELKNIFYDYDKANIRSDASKDLDDLVKMMNMFKSMQIELSSHTDKRGSDKYNEELSANRAKNAKAYLVSKGIAEDRIKAVGYGEYRPKIKCDNCSTYEHQVNRRTEVFITKFDQADYYQVIYSDNKPTIVD